MTTAFLSTLVSLYFLALAAIPLTIVSLLVINHFTNSLNVIAQSFNAHGDKNIAFKKSDTAKLLLRIPNIKSLDCGEKNVHALDRWGGTDYSRYSGVQRFHLKTTNGKLHMVKSYHEFPNYAWDEAFKKATT